ncbi:unnamed protein product [Rotaria magnacalcarata]|uniref:Uncharacterized protein n=3 Tax=Rotaria magnacalcarata TaxID=392030 RepID=A0A816GM32_9BILA|nr:unnamed protein product [Rotaria magnacalcarata]CAF2090572.1 unnamed protein product [Rotaria magnacalcarata]CAF4258438.1 unnamed protein product [Rotaria magnacalcarata]CAF4275735.1 unnamed protein product [Rotaria magnacalcarata]CAF4351633.1 unnamed protein product [Rotaria magnacalcarata]
MASKKAVAIVIGVGPGLGASLAKRFAAGGYSVGLIARKESSLQPVQSELEQSGHTAMSVTADAGDAASVKNAIDTIRKKFDNDPEVLLYNASGFFYGSILDLKPEVLQAALNTTVVGALAASQEVLPAMIKNGKGTILFTGATASLRGSAQFAGFAISKFGLRALGQSMAREFGPQGIHVAHIIVDGGIRSPNQTESQPDKDIDSFLNSEAIAETYWQLHIQPRSTWTQELDLRPSTEEF